jgi:hypothetical protein
VLHSIQDVHGAHQGYSLPLGHALADSEPDRILGDAKFMRAANETFQVLSRNKNASLTAQQVDDLINAIIAGCGKKAKDLRIVHSIPLFGGGTLIGGFDNGDGGRTIYYGGGDFFDSFRWLDMLMESFHENITVSATVGGADHEAIHH